MHHPAYHLLFETLAYIIGMRYYFAERLRDPQSPLVDVDHALWVLVGLIFGAALGSKLLAFLENPPTANPEIPLLLTVLTGKSVVGGLLGGWLGVELTKRLRGIRVSTGDAMAMPILLGIAIGRIGCFMAGLDDGTHGNPTTAWTAYDFGDGIRRHPTQLYDIAYALVWMAWLQWRRPALAQTRGDLFKAALLGYLTWRLGVEFLKPSVVLWAGLSPIQWACLLGMACCARHLPRLMTRLLSSRETQSKSES
jgi:phosphatidylglycerol---prolipoprotein diacylglyceryl transferase